MSQTSAAAAAIAFTAIPEVDLRRWHAGPDERTALARDVRQICHEIGFFQLVGHGVPIGFRARYFDLLQSFFELPEDVKAEIDKVRSPHFRGWERVGAELTDNRTDFREQLDVSTENPPNGPDAEPPYLRLDGPNQWLPDTVLPGF
ncbi:MAG TPA: 2-oxoglutarate and iron-dependent oxygenase domain-containing protein, partial [Ilumatobacteraceae bacterium]|nr:2-oxoglutarate and iron-dependent oxygenase domain-containing protein [Ilumatobacteraceae bacterium]